MSFNSQDDAKKHMTKYYYDFFAGGGMAHAGLGNYWHCLYANDICEKKANTYRRNWGGDSLHVADVRDISTQDLPGSADLAWASFPCQDLSLAGKGSGLQGRRSGTFWPFWNLLTQLTSEGRAPRVVVLENVCGALTSHKGEDFRAISSAIANLNYRFGAVIADAVHFVPQSRPRLFIIAVDSNAYVSSALTQAESSALWHPASLVTAYSELPGELKDRWLWWKMESPEARSTVLADLIEDNPSGVRWHTKTETNHILNLMSEVNRKKVVDAKRARRRVVGAIYRRTRPDGKGGRTQRAEVRFDDVAGCLRTPTGGSSRQTLIIVDGSRVQTRLLSPREAARLMGLPESYQLPERYNDAYHIAGDGLVVPVVRHLAKNILNPVVDTLKSWKNPAAA